MQQQYGAASSSVEKEERNDKAYRVEVDSLSIISKDVEHNGGEKENKQIKKRIKKQKLNKYITSRKSKYF